jgi:Spy/CpxP family protein refolding chaperone
MKKLLLMCLVLVGLTTICRAQGGVMRMNPADRAKQMQTQLTLTDDQTAKVTAILQMQASKMDSVRTAANGDRDAMRSAMMPIMTATNDKIKAILTPEQAAAYQKMLDERRARMQQGGGNN